MSFNDTASRILDIINKFIAFVVLLAYLLYSINANWTFINVDIINQIIHYLMIYGPLGLASLVLIEFAIKRGFIIQLVCYLLIAAVIIFQFFPETAANLVGVVNGASVFTQGAANSFSHFIV